MRLNGSCPKCVGGPLAWTLEIAHLCFELSAQYCGLKQAGVCLRLCHQTETLGHTCHPMLRVRFRVLGSGSKGFRVCYRHQKKLWHARSPTVR